MIFFRFSSRFAANPRYARYSSAPKARRFSAGRRSQRGCEAYRPGHRQAHADVRDGTNGSSTAPARTSPVPIVGRSARRPRWGLGGLPSCSVATSSSRSRTARIADPHVKVGLVAGDGGLSLLGRPPSACIGPSANLLTGGPHAGGGRLEVWTRKRIWSTLRRSAFRQRGRLRSASPGLPPIAVRGTKRSLKRAC